MPDSDSAAKNYTETTALFFQDSLGCWLVKFSHGKRVYVFIDSISPDPAYLAIYALLISEKNMKFLGL